MNDSLHEARERLAAAIDSVESGYEFLLAYAAQGRKTDRDTPAAQGPRERLAAMIGAIEGVPGLARDVAGQANAASLGESAAFFAALDTDAAVAVASIRLVLAQSDISSQLVDNLNASIHLRALLTDLFLLDESFGGAG